MSITVHTLMFRAAAFATALSTFPSLVEAQQLSECVELAKVLQERVKITNARDVSAAWATLLTYDRDQLLSMSHEELTNIDLGVPIPVAEDFVVFLEATLTDSSKDSIYQTTREKFRQENRGWLSDKEFMEFSRAYFSPDALVVIEKCFEARTQSQQNGIQMRWRGYDELVNGEISPTLHVSYAKTAALPGEITVTDIDVGAGLKWRDDGSAFKEPITIADGQVKFFRFKRVGNVDSGFPKATVAFGVEKFGVVDAAALELLAPRPRPLALIQVDFYEISDVSVRPPEGVIAKGFNLGMKAFKDVSANSKILLDEVEHKKSLKDDSRSDYDLPQLAAKGSNAVSASLTGMVREGDSISVEGTAVFFNRGEGHGFWSSEIVQNKAFFVGGLTVGKPELDAFTFNGNTGAGKAVDPDGQFVLKFRVTRLK